MRSPRYPNKLPIPGLVVLVASQFAVAADEFGRMPVAQNSKGRDHNKRAGSLWIAGGGFKGGYIYGETDPVGYTVARDRFSVPDMFATVFHQLGLDHRRLRYQHAGRYESSTDDVVTGARIHSELVDTPLMV